MCPAIEADDGQGVSFFLVLALVTEVHNYDAILEEFRTLDWHFVSMEIGGGERATSNAVVHGG